MKSRVSKRDRRIQPVMFCLYDCGEKKRQKVVFVCKACRQRELNGDSKLCRRCRAIKAQSEFPQSRGTLDGLHSYCRECGVTSANESLSRFREMARARSDALVQDGPPREVGMCRAFINLGAYVSQIRCSRKATAGGYCLGHAPAEKRELWGSFKSSRWRAKLAVRAQQIREAELARALADPEVRTLYEEQQRDERRMQVGAAWQVSLDSQMWDSSRESGVDFVAETEAGDLGFVCSPRKRNQIERDAVWVRPLLTSIDDERDLNEIVADYESRMAS